MSNFASSKASSSKDEKNQDLLSLPNLGPASVAQFKKIGITTVDEFMRRDPYQVYEELVEKEIIKPHMAALAAFVGAYYDLPWLGVVKTIRQKYSEWQDAQKNAILKAS